ARQLLGYFAEARGIDAGVDFISDVIAAPLVRRPVRGQPAQARLFLHFARGLVRALEFVADGLDRRGGIHAGLLRVNLPQRRMILDFRVEARLRDRRVVYFAV